MFILCYEDHSGDGAAYSLHRSQAGAEKRALDLARESFGGCPGSFAALLDWQVEISRPAFRVDIVQVEPEE